MMRIDKGELSDLLVERPKPDGEIEKAIDRVKKSPIHRIGIIYKGNGDKREIAETYDPTDSAQHQRDSKDKVYLNDELEAYFPEEQKKITFDFSYIGSGIMRQAYETVVDEFRAEADKWDSAPTPEQAGKLLVRVLGEAVMQAGDHIDPDTKERMLFWMKTSEGAVWRAFYQLMAPVKTRDYNFTIVS